MLNGAYLVLVKKLRW